MFQKLMLAATVMFASGSALALDEYFPKPRVSITFGNSYPVYEHHDHYREVHVPRYREVYVPQPVYVAPSYYNNHYAYENRRHQGWGHRDYRDDWREHKKHKRHHRKHHDDHDD